MAGDVVDRWAGAQKNRQPNEANHNNDPGVVEAAHHEGNEAVGGQARDQSPDDRGNPPHTVGPFSGACVPEMHYIPWGCHLWTTTLRLTRSHCMKRQGKNRSDG